MVGNQDSSAVLTTQKTKAPTKVWTSRSWWNEVPGHYEVRLINATVSEIKMPKRNFKYFFTSFTINKCTFTKILKPNIFLMILEFMKMVS